MKKLYKIISIYNLLPWIILIFMGSTWGLSFSLAKIATDHGGSPYGITFWQAAISALILYPISFAQRPFKFKKDTLKFLVTIALLGTAIPGVLFYMAAPHVPAGILAITTALVPLFTYAIAIPLRIENASATRLTGVFLGVIAILLLVGPNTSLPSPSAIPWVFLACIASVCYAGENIVLAFQSPIKFDAIGLACGMNIFASLILLPITFSFDGLIIPLFPFGELELAILGLGVINATAYTLFIITVRRYGPIFASQTGYVVTLSGVFWGIIIFHEIHSIWVWSSIATMIVGLALVTPNKQTVEKKY